MTSAELEELSDQLTIVRISCEANGETFETWLADALESYIASGGVMFGESFPSPVERFVMRRAKLGFVNFIEYYEPQLVSKLRHHVGSAVQDDLLYFLMAMRKLYVGEKWP